MSPDCCIQGRIEKHCLVKHFAFMKNEMNVSNFSNFGEHSRQFLFHRAELRIMPNYHLDEHVGDHRDKNTTQVAVHVQHTAGLFGRNRFGGGSSSTEMSYLPSLMVKFAHFILFRQSQMFNILSFINKMSLYIDMNNSCKNAFYLNRFYISNNNTYM